MSSSQWIFTEKEGLKVAFTNPKPYMGKHFMKLVKKVHTVAFCIFLFPLSIQAVDTSIIPSDRSTTWNPGLNSVGGIPSRAIIFTTISSATYGNGTIDATAGIQTAINNCPEGQVVQLSSGDFLVTSAIFINKGIVLRGAGPSQTRLMMPVGTNSEVVNIGMRWFKTTQSTHLTTDAVKGSYSVTLSSNPGLKIGEIVLIDQLTDPAITKWSHRSPLGDPSRGWFSRMDRPTGQAMEVSLINGNTITFSTPFHIGFKTELSSQLSRVSQNTEGTPVPAVKYAGLEDLYINGGGNNNISMDFASYSWVKNVESDNHSGKSISISGSYKCTVRDSFFHSTRNPYPGGGGYGIAVSGYASDNLIENNIVWNMNKVMVMQASGGGNVIGYNYMEDAYIGYSTIWVEVGLNASHMTTPHMELFEGNQSFNFDGDNTWGNAVYITVFRNHLTGKRRSFFPLQLTDVQNKRVIGLMEGHWWYTFVGNVLGTSGQDPNDPAPMWQLGYNPENWSAEADPKLLSTTIRDGNFDYFTNTVKWERASQTMPNSLYLNSKPGFFGANIWPWVDPDGVTKVHRLPARQRFDDIMALKFASDTTAPAVSITSPSTGATVSGVAVKISADASDNLGVTGVQFKLDGANLGSEVTSSPYSVTWNTTTLSNGSHVLTAVARDPAGNTTTSSGVAITVNNVINNPTPGSLSITSVRYFPRNGYNARMVGGIIQGSNTSRTSGYVNLATINSVPINGVWSTISIADTTPYKYFRYLSTTGSYGNVAEIEFYNNSTMIVGQTFGTAGSWSDLGSDYTKAFDGNTSTFFDGPTPDGNYVGVDIDDLDGDLLSDAWETLYFLSTSDPRATAEGDPDGDGYSNLSEFKAGTIPLNSSSRLKISSCTFLTPSSFQITWQSVIGVNYEVHSSTDMITWTPISSFAASTTQSSVIHSVSSGEKRKFYRIKIP